MGPLGLALVKGGIGILGGLLGRSKPISAGDNAYSHTSGIMRAAKDFNINPAFLFGNVGQMGGTPGDNSGFGRAVGDAGMLAADALASKPGVGLLGKLQEENTGLRRQNTSLMLHPTVPGIFARASSNARSSAGVGSVLSGQGDGPSSHDPHQAQHKQSRSGRHWYRFAR